jgi:NTP pyrophosphatase (non-canonical NTP hydrolase)
MNLDDMALHIHKTSTEKGFWDPMNRMDKQDHFIFYSKQLAMVHSEVTEVLEALRKSKGDIQVVEELADIIIRVLDLYVGMAKHEAIDLTISLDDILRRKIIFNESRDRLHGVAG